MRVWRLIARVSIVSRRAGFGWLKPRASAGDGDSPDAAFKEEFELLFSEPALLLPRDRSCSLCAAACSDDVEVGIFGLAPFAEVCLSALDDAVTFLALLAPNPILPRFSGESSKD